MTSALIVRPLAEADIERAFRGHEPQSSGLGTEFVRTLDAAFAAIQRQPESDPAVYRDIRRTLLRRFPYALFYVFHEERVLVLACLHERQHPRRWQSRR